jgi:hypothetical protein
MEAASTSETSVNLYLTTQKTEEDSHLHTRRRENVKSSIMFFPQAETTHTKQQAKYEAVNVQVYYFP